jgi:hypothetical protein
MGNDVPKNALETFLDYIGPTAAAKLDPAELEEARQLVEKQAKNRKERRAVSAIRKGLRMD